MKITFIADSTFLFEHQNVRILTDPWIGTTIYGGAWAQFPKPAMRAEDIGRLDYIFISHIHEDHCDPATIAKLDRNATILLMERTPDMVEGFLRRGGYNFRAIQKVPAFRPVQLAEGFAVETLDADPSHELNHLIDSSLLLHADGRTIYFSNDNAPYPRVAAHLKHYDVALALLLASGGSGYPECFVSLSEAERLAERDRIVKSYFNIFADTVAEIRPERFMTCAGNHVLVGRHAAQNHAATFLRDPAEAYRYVHDRLSPFDLGAIAPLDLGEGQSWTVPEKGRMLEREAEEAWALACSDRGRVAARNAFIRDEAPSFQYDHDLAVLPADIDWEQLFLTAGRTLLEKVARTKLVVKSRLYIELPTGDAGRWGMVDAMANNLAIVEGASRHEPYLEVSADPALLHQLLTGRFSWNIADAAAFLTYRRIPNIYDPAAVIALNYLRVPSVLPADLPL